MKRMDIARRAIIPIAKGIGFAERQDCMSPELVAIIAMGFLVIGVQMTIFIYTMQRIDKLSDRIASLEVELKGDMAALRVEMVERMTTLEVSLNERMTTLEVGLNERMTTLEVGLNERMTTLEVSLTERVARLEGVVLARTESGNGTVGTAGDD